jgi:hypothetical protein
MGKMIVVVAAAVDDWHFGPTMQHFLVFWTLAG